MLITGPPRSGTTFLTRSLGEQPTLRALIDDAVYERWSLYYYPTRTGLAADLRRGAIEAEDARDCLMADLVSGDTLRGVAASPHTAGYPRSSPPRRPDGTADPRDARLDRRDIPLAEIPWGTRFILKSPELSFVMPAMADALPGVRWIAVVRPLEEIAESMYRKGNSVQRPVFHRRWASERDAEGRPAPFPGIPDAWADRWRSGAPADWCALAAAAYVRALADTLPGLPAGTWHLHDHARLRREPSSTLGALAAFLGIAEPPLAWVALSIKAGVPQPPPEIVEACRRVRSDPQTGEAFDRLETLSRKALEGSA
ncbi:MAG: sulfotransferase [Acidobacteria bacterium]|nr:sulfotransferase [Acidobacteriota bacterium]